MDDLRSTFAPEQYHTLADFQLGESVGYHYSNRLVGDGLQLRIPDDWISSKTREGW